MNSMTGFGRTAVKHNGIAVEVELRSVNHRFLNLKYDIPYQISIYEGEMEKLLKASIKRGAVTLSISIKQTQNTPLDNLPNAETLISYYKYLNRVKRGIGIKEPVTFEAVLSIPQIWSANNKSANLNRIPWDSVKTYISKALNALIKMRQREGTAIKTECMKRLSFIKTYANNIEKRAPTVIMNYQKRLDSRINDLLRSKGLEMSKADISRELAIFSERCDINEELQRLLSHINQFTTILDTDGEVGRRLDFITQEMAREANTLASKGNDYLVSKYAVDIKVEIEKLKELAENIE